MNILKFVSTSLLLFVALTCGAGAKETAVEAKKVAKKRGGGGKRSCDKRKTIFSRNTGKATDQNGVID